MKYFENAIFFPAVSMATFHTIMRKDWRIEPNRTSRFYLNGLTPTQQLFHHPYLLVSAGHNYRDATHMKTLGINCLNKDVDMVVGDSGGFQLATGEIKNTPKMIDTLYTWLENNCTISPIIDCPPWTTPAADITQVSMDKGIEGTKKNVDTLFSRPQVPDHSWLNVVQGRTYEQRTYWYHHVKDFNLQGWALGSMRKNAHYILTSFASLFDNSELENTERCKMIHFFGFSATRYIPCLLYIKHKMNKAGYKVNISFDSSYPIQDGGYGKYFLHPNASGFTSYHLSNKYLGKFVDGPLPCECPVCKGVNLGDILRPGVFDAAGQNLFYNVVQSHNLRMLCEYVKVIDKLFHTDCPGLWETAFKAKQLKVFKVIDKMFDAPKGKSITVIENNAAILNKLDIDTSGDEQYDISDMFESAEI